MIRRGNLNVSEERAGELTSREKGRKAGREKGQAGCSFRTTTNEGRDDWPDSLSVAPIRSHVTRFINPFRANSEKFRPGASYYRITFRSRALNDVNT